jgi:hypothetical protein
VKTSDLIANYPRLYHMAHEGSWPAIRDHGLMSASALLDVYGLKPPDRTALESAKRPESVSLSCKGLPGAVLRDQKPMHDSALKGCLQDGLSPKDWYEILNSKSFFWLSRGRIWRLLQARAYRDKVQTVLTIDSAGLIQEYAPKMWLSPINSGSTLFNPQPRGKGTFGRIQDFPFEQRSRTRSLENNVVELVVEYSVPNIAKHVLAVHEVKNDDVIAELWRSASASVDEHP